MSKSILFDGQSNCEGYGGTVASLTAPWTGLSAAYPAVRYCMDIAWPADGVSAPLHTRGWGDLEPLTMTNGDMGPELQIGRVLDAYEAGQWRIIKSARGSTSMDEWEPGRTETHRLYDRTHDRVDERLSEDGGGHTVDGLIWVQGTNDAATLELSKAYGGKLVNLIHAVRAKYGSCLPVVINLLHKNCTHAHTRYVRQAQRSIAQNMPNIAIVDCDDLTNGLNHYDDNGFCELGDRLGNAMVALLTAGAPTQPHAGWICATRS